jgi:hypothetical protein
MWFVLAALLLARKSFSTAAQVSYTVHMYFNIKTVCLHYVILEMHSFPMSAAKHFYDNPLSIYLDPKLVLIYRPHPVDGFLYQAGNNFGLLLKIQIKIIMFKNILWLINKTRSFQ